MSQRAIEIVAIGMGSIQHVPQRLVLGNSNPSATTL